MSTEADSLGSSDTVERDCNPGCSWSAFGFGTAALDFRIRTAELGPGYTEKLLAQQTQIVGGGAMANWLVQVARLGGNASWLGKLGEDWVGDYIVEDLGGEGVDCSRVVRDASSCSPFSLAVFAGQRRRRVGGFLVPNSLAEVTQEEIRQWAACLHSGNWLLVEIGELPLWAVTELCRAVQGRGVRVAVDVDLDPIVQCEATPAEVTAIFELADLLIPNGVAMKSLYAGASAPELARRMAGDFGVTTVVTAGGGGAYFCRPDQPVRHQPAVAVDVVETLGAGDAFHGGLVFALAEGRPLDDAVGLAARCGAEACRFPEARPGMLTAARLRLQHIGECDQ